MSHEDLRGLELYAELSLPVGGVVHKEDGADYHQSKYQEQAGSDLRAANLILHSDLLESLLIGYIQH